MESCPKLEVPCCFLAHGCTVMCARDKMAAHRKKFGEQHADLLASALTRVKDEVKGLASELRGIKEDAKWQKINLVWTLPKRKIENLLTTDVLESTSVPFGIFRVHLELSSESYGGPLLIRLQLPSVWNGPKKCFENISVSIEGGVKTYKSDPNMSHTTTTYDNIVGQMRDEDGEDLTLYLLKLNFISDSPLKLLFSCRLRHEEEALAVDCDDGYRSGYPYPPRRSDPYDHSTDSN
jgi:hypothetical protein